MCQMYQVTNKVTNNTRLLIIILCILCLHVVVTLPGKFIPVSRTSNHPVNDQSLTQDEVDRIKRFRELLARRGARAKISQVELPAGDTDTETGNSDVTETEATDETLDKLRKKKKKMKKEWKKFKKWRRRKRRKKKLRKRIIQMITSKLEGKLQAAGGKLKGKNLKKIFDII